MPFDSIHIAARLHQRAFRLSISAITIRKTIISPFFFSSGNQRIGMFWGVQQNLWFSFGSFNGSPRNETKIHQLCGTSTHWVQIHNRIIYFVSHKRYVIMSMYWFKNKSSDGYAFVFWCSLWHWSNDILSKLWVSAVSPLAFFVFTRNFGRVRSNEQVIMHGSACQ